MFLSIIKGIKKRKTAFFLFTITMGLSTGVISALIASLLNVKERISRELKSFGSNIVVLPQNGGFLYEKDVFKIKQIFWKHNILGFSPELVVQMNVEGINAKVIGVWINRKVTGMFSTGIKSIFSRAKVKGKWIYDVDEDAVLLGSTLAERLKKTVGDRVKIGERIFIVKGIIKAGEEENQSVLIPLGVLQKMLNLKGKINRIKVVALTVPIDDFGRRDPTKMTEKEYEKWYCTPYVTSVSKQIEEVIRNGKARPVWRVVETEGFLVRRLGSFFLFGILFIILISLSVAFSGFQLSLVQRKNEFIFLKAISRPFRFITVIMIEEVVKLLCGGIFAILFARIFFYITNTTVFNNSLNFRFIYFFIPLLILIVIYMVMFPINFKEVKGTKAGEITRIRGFG